MVERGSIGTTERQKLEEEHARRLIELEEANETLQLVNELATDFLTGASFEHSLKSILETARKLIPADMASVAVYEQGDVMTVWVYDLGAGECAVQSPPGLGHSFPNLAAKYSSGIVIDNEMTETFAPPGHVPMHNLLSVSIDVKDGWANIVLANKEGGFTADDARKSRILARLASIIVDRARLDEAERAARNAVERRAAEYEALISSLADGVSLLDAHGNLIWMNDAGRAILGASAHETFVDWETRYLRYTLDGRPLPRQDIPVLRALRGETVPDVRYKVVSPFGKETIISISVAPVRGPEGRIIGVTDVFRDVTDQVALERQRELIYEREHIIADTLQRALLPSVVIDIPCYSIAAGYQPALTEAEVGGDFYDAFELGEGRLALVMGDVSGKGLQAAVHTAMAKYMLRAYAHENCEPRHVMTRLNEAMCDNTPEDLFVTIFYGILDPQNHTLTYCNAGHDQPLVYNAEDGWAFPLDVTGRAVGLFHGSVFSERTLDLDAGDVLFLYTDGVTDARSDGRFFGIDGLSQVLVSNIGKGERQIIETVFKAAMHAADGHLRDDAAILILRAKRSRR